MKTIKMTVFAALVGLMASSKAFSAEYMICSVSANSSFAMGLPAVKNGNVTCEGENAKQGVEFKMSDLRGQGWKVDHMSAATGERGRSTLYFLMLKD